MNITYYGHSCFGVEVGGKKLLFDPFITPNPLASSIKVSEIPADYILVSHGHGDHIADCVDIAKRTGATVVAAFEVCNWLNAKGVDKTYPMNLGGNKKFEFGNVKCVVAQHSSALPDGSYGGNPMGFVVSTEEGNFYFAGDTALTWDMKLLGEYSRLSFAFLPVGDNFTMGADDAVIAADFIGCSDIIGMHYDSFGFIKIDHAEAVSKFERAGKTLTLMPVGGTITKP